MQNEMAESWTDRESRKYDRMEVLWAGGLFAYIENRISDCVILNFSANGAMVTSDETFSAGTSITLNVAGIGEFYGEVVWRKLKSMGVKFVENPEIVARVTGVPLSPWYEAA